MIYGIVRLYLCCLASKVSVSYRAFKHAHQVLSRYSSERALHKCELRRFKRVPKWARESEGTLAPLERQEHSTNVNCEGLKGFLSELKNPKGHSSLDIVSIVNEPTGHWPLDLSKVITEKTPAFQLQQFQNSNTQYPPSPKLQYPIPTGFRTPIPNTHQCPSIGATEVRPVVHGPCKVRRNLHSIARIKVEMIT